jgi:hypothetical protein
MIDTSFKLRVNRLFFMLNIELLFLDATVLNKRQESFLHYGLVSPFQETVLPMYVPSLGFKNDLSNTPNLPHIKQFREMSIICRLLAQAIIVMASGIYTSHEHHINFFAAMNIYAA